MLDARAVQVKWQAAVAAAGWLSGQSRIGHARSHGRLARELYLDATDLLVQLACSLLELDELPLEVAAFGCEARLG